MTLIAFLRHGETKWNRDKRIQGHTDISLAPEATAFLQARRVPDGLQDIPWATSPLARARETAAALELVATSAGALIEMHWGDWEGETLAAIRAADPGAMAANEARGLDFRPQGGESPAEVLRRVRGWAASLEDGTYGAVSHKGVIRAALAEALDWDMTSKIPAKIDWAALQVLRFRGGRLQVEALNIPLEAR